MSKKIKIIITFSVVILVYFVSYFISMYKFTNDNPRMTIKTQLETVKKETKVQLTSRYLKSGEETINNLPLDEKLIGRDMNYVKDYFKDKYTVINASSRQISLEKDYDTYSPGKYYISVYNDKLTIFHIDNNLKIVKVKETDIFIDQFQDYDRTALETGNKDFQFNTLEEAEESLTDYTS